MIIKPIGKKDGKRTLVQFILLNVAFAWELNMLSLRKFALSKVFLKQQSISYDRLTYCLKSFPLLYVLSLGMPSPTRLFESDCLTLHMESQIFKLAI